MTPRERIRTALNHEEPDRVPIDPFGYRSLGIAAMPCARQLEHELVHSPPMVAVA